MAIYRGPGGAGDATTDSTSEAIAAVDAAAQAQTSATNAASSASQAATSATNAASSATSASNSASTASSNASASNTYATSAANSATSALSSKTSAETAATNAAASQTLAANSATAAGTSATAAASSASSAASSATSANNYANSSAASANAAAVSETNAATSAAAALSSKNAAATSATNAATSASNALTSESNALTYKNAAATSATNAATSESNALTYKNAAQTSATNAATSATAAAGSATSAASAQIAAEQARDQTLSAYDSFDDRYLGTKASDPTLDNDGNALVAGALYFNSTDGSMKVYSGTAWLAAYASLSGALLAANNLSDVASVSSARTNLGVSATGADTTYAYRANNLSDLANVTTARTNLGLGTAALVADNTLVHLAGTETITGAKTFSSTITGSITGNAGTATTATNQSGGTVAATTGSFSSTVTLSGGTANGVAYLNGSKVLTTGSALTFNGSTLSVTGNFTSNNAGNENYLLSDGTNRSSLQQAGAGFYLNANDNIASGGQFIWRINSGLSEQMRLTSTGLGIGTSSPGAKLHIYGANAQSKVEDSGTSYAYSNYVNSGSNMFVGQERAAGGALASGSSAYAGIIATQAAYPLQFGTNGAVRATLDSSGNLGLGVTPSAWANYKVLQAGAASFAGYGTGNNAYFGANYSSDGNTDKYINTGYASRAIQANGTHSWYTAPSGTAGTAISFTQAMTLDASGNLGVGGTATANGSGYTTLGVNGSTAGIIEWQAGGVRQGQSYATTGAMYIGSTTSIPFVLTTANSERIRIDSSGKVGIGTSTAAYDLQVYNTSGTISIGGAPTSNGTGRLKFINSNSVTNWQISTNDSQSGALEFMPSTAAGGSTFTTPAMLLNSSGNLGLGVTPSAWNTVTAMQVGNTSYGSVNNALYFGANYYYQSGWKYITTAASSKYEQYNGAHTWYTAPSGTAGNPITFTQAMTLDASGNLLVGVSSTYNSNKFYVNTNSGTNAAFFSNNVDATFQIALASGVTKLDAPTGILTLATSGSERMRIDSSGNVGIGTSSPASKLNVAGSAGTAPEFRVSAATVYQKLIADDTVGYGVLDSAYSSLFRVDGSEKMRIAGNGNVGIGTNSPATKLAVSGGIAGTAGLNVSGGGWGVLPYVANSLVIDNNSGQARFFATGADATTDGSFLFYTSQTDGGANERMRIDSSGNLLFNSGYGSAATAYGCRAWVNFNGTGTVAIRASGNVSSITDNGTGNWTVNLSTAMPDANYSAVSGVYNYGSSPQDMVVASTINTSSFIVRGMYTGGGDRDIAICCAAIFR